MNLVIYCADIGSVKRGNFGWARLTLNNQVTARPDLCDMRCLVDAMAQDLNSNSKVALGFECPLFVPVSSDPAKLTSARIGEGDRPWSAGAGAGSLATGLTQTQWILHQLRLATTPVVNAFLSWQEFQEADAGLFVWEAFVTKSAKASSHRGDAELAATAFRAALPNPEAVNAIEPSIGGLGVRSLIGAALLQSGWLADISCLSKPCLVIRVEPKKG